MKKLLLVLLLAPSLIFAQGSGTPNSLRVRTDSNNILLAASSIQTPPYTTSVFSNTRLKTDADGNLLIAISGGGGAPSDAEYWVGAANGSLSAEKNLGALATGLVLNTSGTPSAYAGSSCTNQFPRSTSASGAWTCASVLDADLGNVDFSFPQNIYVGGTPGSGVFFGDGSTLNTPGFSGFGAVGIDRASWYFYNGATDRAAPIMFAFSTSTKTDGITLPQNISNIVYLSGDADGQAYTLPNDPADLGITWRFLVTQTQTMNSVSIAPNTGETLRYNSGTCSTFTSIVRDSYAVVMTTSTGSGGHFTVLDAHGTWVCTP